MRRLLSRLLRRAARAAAWSRRPLPDRAQPPPALARADGRPPGHHAVRTGAAHQPERRARHDHPRHLHRDAAGRPEARSPRARMASPCSTSATPRCRCPPGCCRCRTSRTRTSPPTSRIAIVSNDRERGSKGGVLFVVSITGAVPTLAATLDLDVNTGERGPGHIANCVGNGPRTLRPRLAHRRAPGLGRRPDEPEAFPVLLGAFSTPRRERQRRRSGTRGKANTARRPRRRARQQGR